MNTQNSNETKKEDFDPNKMRRKSFLVQKLINFLLVVRLYLTQIPLYLWVIIIITLYLVKLKRQGNIPSSILLLIAIVFNIVGEYLKIDIIYLLAPVFAGICHFLSYQIYWFPKTPAPIGIRQETLQNDTYQMELYPIKKNQNVKRKVLFWNHRLQYNKMLEHQQVTNLIHQILFKFFISAMMKIKVIFAEGDQSLTNQAIIFSHGRTSTPMMYSQLLSKIIAIQPQKYKIFAVQHVDKKITGQSQLPKIKRFREIQVQSRAAQMYSSVTHCQNSKKIVLMGHSYGGATTIQTYHSLSQQLKQKVSHLVLLDPWLFPLNQAKMDHPIKCPVLILACQYFVQNQEVYNRNRSFVNAHKKDKVIYLTWKNADHLHQTDLGFVLGTIFHKVKHPELCIEMLNKNVQAIKYFLQDKSINQSKMRQKFEKDLFPADYKPQKWNNYLTL